jgi:hypothetical protein
MVTAHTQDYGKFLSAEVRGDGPGSPPLPEGGAAELASDGAGGSPKKKKKRKLDGSCPAPATDVSWTIRCMDGTTFSPVVPEDAVVAELKRAIGALREVPCFTMELFLKDVEDALDDEKPLRSLARGPLFLLLKPASDRLALEALFKSAGGSGWEEKGGWMTDADLGEWHGVTVDEEGRVTELELGGNGLGGRLMGSIQQLSALQILNLFENELSGPIPTELGQLAALTELNLDANRLAGPIPAELGQIGALTQLYLGNNQLSGPIPAELGQLGALQELALDTNQLTGQIPPGLAQLGALRSLWLHENQLTGQIPLELAQLGALQELCMSENQLTGQEAFHEYMEEHNPDCDCELYL